MLLRLLFLLILPFLAVGQHQLRFNHLSIRDGLSHNTINCFLKDSEGYYWLGTQDGLNRFDGYSMEVFRYDRNDSLSISDNFILSLFEDNNRNIWIGTRNGLNFYQRCSGKIFRVPGSKEEEKHFHNSVYNIIQDVEGDILFSNVFFQCKKIKSGNIKGPPFCAELAQLGTIVYNQSNSWYSLYDTASQSLIVFDKKSPAKSYKIPNFTCYYNTQLLTTQSGDLLLASGKGILRYFIKNPRIKPDTLLNGKYITKIIQDKAGNIWTGTTDGLYIFEKENFLKAPLKIMHNKEDPGSLSSSNVQGLYEDEQGLIWVGTSEGGANIYDPQTSVFSTFNRNTDVKLPSNSVWAIFQDGNELWLGTSEGICFFKLENNLVNGLYSNTNKINNYANWNFSNVFPNTVCSNFITSIIKDKNGRMWFASSDKGISIYDASKKGWRHINSKNSPIKSDVIFHLMQATDGKIWIASMTGFYSYNPLDEKFNSFLPVGLEGGILPVGYIISVYEDKDSTIWAASTIGIYHFKKTGEKINFYFSDKDNKKTLSYNMGTQFLRDSKGRFWVTTLGGGLNRYNEEKNLFTSYTKKEGLGNDVIYSLQESNDGNLWMSTNSGLSCFYPEEEKFYNYTKSDGLIANEFCQNAAFKNKSGELFFGSPEGLVVFNPSQVRKNYSDIKLILKSVRVNYKLVPSTDRNVVNLFYGDQSVVFEFSAPDFRNREKIQYEFQMDGFDNNWHAVPSSERVASFTNLPYGNYVFRVRIKVGNDNWQEKMLAVTVNVIPPFWLRIWFIVIEILATILAIIFIVRYYSHRKLKDQIRQIETQQKIHLEKERISRDLHDNVGSHLTYIITSLDNINSKTDKEADKEYSEKIALLSDFSRSTMQQLRETIWAINKESVALAELINKINEYSGRMAEANNMLYNFEISNNSKTIIKPSLAINIYRVIQEAVNNSVKHSEAEKLNVSVHEKDERIINIQVVDNGKGIKSEDELNGYGLKNMRDRVTEMNGKFNIESNHTGTKINFTIPL